MDLQGFHMVAAPGSQTSGDNYSSSVVDKIDCLSGFAAALFEKAVAEARELQVIRADFAATLLKMSLGAGVRKHLTAPAGFVVAEMAVVVEVRGNQVT